MFACLPAAGGIGGRRRIGIRPVFFSRGRMPMRRFASSRFRPAPTILESGRANGKGRRGNVICGPKPPIFPPPSCDADRAVPAGRDH